MLVLYIADLGRNTDGVIQAEHYVVPTFLQAITTVTQFSIIVGF